ncbi:MAG: flagellar basal body-associated protein FliL, partial [bacterium]
MLVGTIISIFMIFSFASWSFYEHFMKRANAIQEANYYVPIPEIVVNLRSVNTKGNILRTNLSLQVYHKEDEVKIKEFMPVILDQILSYLRDQSVGDLEGPGLDRMREAILL